MAIKIGIIGAGPAGLITALALETYCKSNNQLEITLIDRNKSAYDYPGAEYGIQKRACLALQRIGIKEKALERGIKNFRISFFNSKINKKQKSSVATNPDLTVGVVRQEFLHDLTQLLHRTKMHRELTVNSVNAVSNKVTILAKDLNGLENTFEFDFLVSAEGIHSIVRKDYFKHQNYIHNRGFSSLYMLLEVPEYISHRMKDLANTGESWIVLGKSTTATFFPMEKNRIGVGIGFDDETQIELWHKVGLESNVTWADIPVDIKRKIAELLAADCSFENNILTDAFEWVQDWNSYKIYLWKMRDSDVALQPYNQHGNIVMIGDAAHAIMPTIGMGASLAIEDAEMLAKHLAKVINANSTNFKSAIENFSSLRVPVWKDLMNRARTAARLNFIGVRHKNRFAVGPQLPGRYFWRVVAKLEELIG
jgi:salicylate hydroxylase